MAKTPLRDFREFKVSGFVDLDMYLRNEIVGQSRAIDETLGALNIAGAGLLPDQCTITNLAFTGPTGVGKTETALVLARWLKSQELADGVEYPDLPLITVEGGISVSDLIGSSIGIVGSKAHKEGATRPLLARENFPPDRIMVLLWDELEKSFGYEQTFHYGGEELLKILLPVFDKAELLTKWDLDTREPTSFEKTINIVTSNIGAKKIVEQGSKRIGFLTSKKGGSNHLSDEEVEEINKRIYELIKEEYKFFPPELRNRIDRHIVFRLLTRSNFAQILEKLLRQFREQLEEAHDIGMELSDDTKEWLLNFGMVREEGARSLKRAFRRKITNAIATYINAGEIGEGSTVEVDVQDPREDDTKVLFFKS